MSTDPTEPRARDWSKAGSIVAGVAAPFILSWLLLLQSGQSALNASVTAIGVGLNGGNGAIGMSTRLEQMQAAQIGDSKKLDDALALRPRIDQFDKQMLEIQKTIDQYKARLLLAADQLTPAQAQDAVIKALGDPEIIKRITDAVAAEIGRPTP